MVKKKNRTELEVIYAGANVEGKKPEDVRRVICNHCGEKVFIWIDEVPKIIEKEVIKEVPIFKEPEVPKEELKQVHDFIERNIPAPDHITHEHKINISLTAMIFSLLSMLALVVLIKFL
jgi:hypothetical protein